MAFSLLQRFKRYFSVGILNTALHWAVFFVAYYLFSASQAVSNLLAFLIAATFSFYMNARYTYKASATGVRYAAFVSFMAALSVLTGYLADIVNLLPLLTVVVFSVISLCAGFLYTNYVVFRSDS